ncbi:GntR family transcriptional regulator [Thalassobacillus pellis]|uniref:GntR family transcriptional regulator n=1 Tax=Thalassobacillus pellis TaxID=748008 RepID=UPI00195FD755|nr:GntR family transcriptional regulator [Thalassobacillus pellis]MBM7554306.1 GntR family transcriptional regulator [Thalassobacillus pellis]
MDILISQTSKTPLYQQIKEQIKEHVWKGKLQEGDSLPSMRTLAKNLQVSVITTKRAYEELESEGFIFSSVGKGTFIAGQQSHVLKEWQIRELENQLEKIVLEAKRLGLTDTDIKAMVEIYYRDGDTN